METEKVCIDLSVITMGKHPYISDNRYTILKYLRKYTGYQMPEISITGLSAIKVLGIEL